MFHFSYVTLENNKLLLLTESPRKFQRLQDEEKGTCKDSAGQCQPNVFIENQSIVIIKRYYFLSIGFPGPVWQDRGLYIRPPIKDPVEKSCPGGVELQNLLYCVLYIALWATAKCTENFKCGAAPCLFIVDVTCMKENPVNRRGGWLSAPILGTAGLRSPG